MVMKKLLTIDATLTTITGVHIGCSSSELGKVGGCDNPVIKDSLTGLPYIPGSSIKGKMRATLEQIQGYSKSNGSNPCNCGHCKVCKLFGNMAKEIANSAIARLSVPDMVISETFLNQFKESHDIADITEIKAATAIDRNAGKAKTGSLRNEERIVPGLKFSNTFVLKVFDEDNEQELINTIKRAVEILNQTGIGSKTSSGSGRIKLELDWDNAKNLLN